MNDFKKNMLMNVVTLITDGDWIESKDQSDEGIRLVQTGNIGEGKYLDKKNNAKYINEETFIRLKCTEIFEGDVLISRLPTPVGRACIIPKADARMITAVDCTILRFNNEICLPQYFVYYSQSPVYLQQIAKHLYGSTRVRISRKNLESIWVPVPPIDVQKQIAKTLDTASELLSMRKQHLAELDNLIKSVFYDMFGDLAFNNYNWKVDRLVEACAKSDDIKCGPFGTQLKKDDYQDKGVPLWGIPHINSFFSIPTREFITEEKAASLEAYSIIEHDITMSRKGNVGKCALYPGNLSDGIMHSDVLRIRLDQAIANPIFMLHQLHFSNYIQNQIKLVSSGAIMAGVNVTKLKNIFVHVPPIELQNQFAGIVTKIEEQKTLVKQSINEAQYLFDSLMSEYFE
ncbi:restriction endonuclease subunit S [Paenibacillus polymyxa]|uniref:restriction endonuclease subunit S n=1 Tax=Paenibacillus polymyxa TaxID=1406 RepID=UPI0032AFCAE6